MRARKSSSRTAARRRSTLGAFAVAASMTVAHGVPTSAAAHDGPPGRSAVLDPLHPTLSKLEIATATVVTPQINVTNRTNKTLEVLDDTDTPFLRIGPAGVHANVASAAWEPSNDPRGVAASSRRSRRRDNDVVWQRVARRPTWNWFDHRTHPANIAVEVDESEAAPLRWSIPVRIGRKRSEISGQVVQRPVRGEIVAAPLPAARIDGLDMVPVPTDPPALLIDASVDAVVLGTQGEPFLRFSRHDVQANTRSPTWWYAARVHGNVPDAAIDAAAKPRWRRVSPIARLQWADPRIAYIDGQPPEAIVSAGAAVTLGEWAIPIRVAGEQVVVRGLTRWVPFGAEAATLSPMSLEPEPSRLVGAILGTLTAGTAVWAFVRIRRRSPLASA